MTDQKYKLLPVEPTEEMWIAMYNALSSNPTSDITPIDVRLAVRAVIAAAPEPVCRWEHVNGEEGLFNPDCNTCNVGGDLFYLSRFCPNCGRKVEVVGNE